MNVSPGRPPKGLITPRSLEINIFKGITSKVQYFIDNCESAQWLPNKELPERSNKDGYAKAMAMHRLAVHMSELIARGFLVNFGIQQNWELRSMDLCEEEDTTHQDPPQTEPDFVGDHVVYIVLSIKGSFLVRFEHISGEPNSYQIMVESVGFGYALGQESR